MLKKPGPRERDLLRRETALLLERAAAEVASGRYDGVFFDEVLAAWKLGLLGVRDLREAAGRCRAAGVRLLVCTGRWAPKSIVAAADLVTEVKKVKHPFDRGRKARSGIDY